MINKILNTFIPFALGYWVGQTKHGINPLILGLIFMSIDFFLIKVGKYYYTKFKNKQYNPSVQ